MDLIRGQVHVRRAIEEAVSQGHVEKKELFEKGVPVLLKLKGAADQLSN